MAQQIRTKFIANDAISGDKIKLLAGEAIRAVDGANVVDLLKLDNTGKVLLKGSEVALQTALAAEVTRAQGAESALGTRIDNVIENTDPAALDSLKEVVTAFQAADSNLNGAITSLAQTASTNLAQEVQDRIAGDAATLTSAETYADAGDVTTLQSAKSYADTQDAANLVTAKSYADTQDAANLVTAKSYADTQDAANLVTAKAYTDSKVAAIPPVDLSGVQADILALQQFGYDQIIYVSKNGVDTNSGKQHAPFLTITAAMNAISDASPTKRYVIKVAAGNYTEASLALKANVVIVGESKESVRITGAVSMGASFTAGGSVDNRSGFSMVTLLSAADFNWNTVQSAAGKLYFNEVVFGSTVNLYGYNNAIAQAQFNACVIFGNMTISGINVGVFTNNVCYGNVTLSQHPNGGMATLLVATGGYCSGTIRQTTTVSDFNRRCASFLREFSSEYLIVDGPSSYADFTIDSGSKQGAQALNGGTLAPMNAVVSQRIVPNLTETHNMGDWGKQWMYNFAYVHASTGSDLYLTSVAASYDPAGDTAGRTVWIQPDGYGLQANVNGGDIVLETAVTSGTGVRGKVLLNGRLTDANDKKIINLADAVDTKDAVNKGQLDSVGTRVSTLEAKGYQKGSATIGAQLAYLDLDRQYDKILFMAVGRLAIHEGEDYTLSVVGGVTRVTWIGSLVNPGGAEQIETGDKIFWSGTY